MAFVSHRHRLIFLKTRKTAGSSVEVWLAPLLDPTTDLAALTADLAAIDPHLAAQFRPGRLTGHATAEQVRRLVGEHAWQSYFKLSIERDPWDRLISLWRWREERRGESMTLDDFLTAMESGDTAIEQAYQARHWSNWPIYAIGNEIIADQIVQFARLEEELGAALARVGLRPAGTLPRLKAGRRRPDDTAARLTLRQKQRIGRLFAKEIEAFGYREP